MVAERNTTSTHGNIATTRQLLAQAVRHLDQLSSSERSGSPASDHPPRHSDISSNVQVSGAGARVLLSSGSTLERRTAPFIRPTQERLSLFRPGSGVIRTFSSIGRRDRGSARYPKKEEEDSTVAT